MNCERCAPASVAVLPWACICTIIVYGSGRRIPRVNVHLSRTILALRTEYGVSQCLGYLSWGAHNKEYGSFRFTSGSTYLGKFNICGNSTERIFLSASSSGLCQHPTVSPAALQCWFAVQDKCAIPYKLAESLLHFLGQLRVATGALRSSIPQRPRSLP